MGKKSLLVVTESNSDLLELLLDSDIKLHVVKPDEVSNTNLQDFHSIAILGGVSDRPLMFHPTDRIVIDEFIDRGGKVFCEYVSSISELYFSPPKSTKKERLVFCQDSDSISGLNMGDILDDQHNMRIGAYYEHEGGEPILQYAEYIKAHSNTEVDNEFRNDPANRALWFDKPNLLVCCFRLSNFLKARFAPRKKWIGLVKYIIEWLCEDEVSLGDIPKYYRLSGCSHDFESSIRASIDRGMNWFYDAGILLDKGKMGVLEGIGSEIYPDGKQQILTNIRADCIGETSMAFMFYYLLEGDSAYLEISDNLTKTCFDFFQIKEGPYKGMVRWSNEGWGVCYQDDVARAIMPYLFKSLYLEDKSYLDNCIDALNFLVDTTGTDGLRVQRTDNISLTFEKMEELRNSPGGFPSAHYNAYYLATLLLAYKLTDIEKFKDVGIKGMESIMSVYPDTVREHSQTQELCRLIMPSAFLYWVTGEEGHKDFLYTVVEDLQAYRHDSGAYVEWDEGYKATMSRNEDGECSLLTKNGDPVVDMLYSVNWLPMAFMQAYFITEDNYFKNLWQDIAKFMISVQLRSDDKKLDGGWTRAMDVELMEVFASPYDIGWGPWSIESGWTVAEIVSGLMSGLLSDELVSFY